MKNTWKYMATPSIRDCLISVIVTLNLALTKFLVFFLFKFLLKYISYYFHVFVIKKVLASDIFTHQDPT